MRALRNQLTAVPTEDNEGLISLAAQSYNVGEWIAMVDIWLRVLQSLNGLLSHMARNSGDGPLDDAVERLRETIERDLFIPPSPSTAKNETANTMEQ